MSSFMISWYVLVVKYYSGEQSRRWAGHVTHWWGSRCAYRVLVWKPEGKKPLQRPRTRWDDNFFHGSSSSGMDGHGLDWSSSGQGQVAGSCKWTFGFHKMRGISWLTADLFASRKGTCLALFARTGRNVASLKTLPRVGTPDFSLF